MDERVDAFQIHGYALWCVFSVQWGARMGRTGSNGVVHQLENLWNVSDGMCNVDYLSSTSFGMDPEVFIGQGGARRKFGKIIKRAILWHSAFWHSSKSVDFSHYCTRSNIVNLISSSSTPKPCPPQRAWSQIVVRSTIYLVFFTFAPFFSAIFALFVPFRYTSIYNTLGPAITNHQRTYQTHLKLNLSSSCPWWTLPPFQMEKPAQLHALES